jgi:hypothetical protein
MYKDKIDGILEYQRRLCLLARSVVTRLQEQFKGRGRHLSELLDAPFEPSRGPLSGGRLLAFSDGEG